MQRLILIAIATTSAWALADAIPAARCTYIAGYPGAIGKQTYLLATATPGKRVSGCEVSGSLRK